MNTPGHAKQIREHRRALAAAAADCLSRAAGQQGAVRLPIRLDNPPGGPAPCNAATLIEILWRVDPGGRLRLKAAIDGAVFEEVFT